MIAGSPTTLRDELREKTAHLHRQTEIALDLMGPTMSLERYRSVLQQLHAVYSFIEPVIVSHEGWSGIGIDMRSRRKLPLLDADLLFIDETIHRRRVHEPLGAGSSLVTTRGLSGRFLDSFPAVLGAAYVVEGSTLGGTIIHRHVAQLLGFDGGAGTLFFHGYGADTGTRWKQFVEALNRAPLVDGCWQRAAAGAVGTFELLLRSESAGCRP